MNYVDLLEYVSAENGLTTIKKKSVNCNLLDDKYKHDSKFLRRLIRIVVMEIA
jgi:hypothetical protein